MFACTLISFKGNANPRVQVALNQLDDLPSFRQAFLRHINDSKEEFLDLISSNYNILWPDSKFIKFRQDWDERNLWMQFITWKKLSEISNSKKYDLMTTLAQITLIHKGKTGIGLNPDQWLTETDLMAPGGARQDLWCWETTWSPGMDTTLIYEECFELPKV